MTQAELEGRDASAGEAGLLARLRAGDEAAFEGLVARHYATMLAVAMTYVKGRATAEEVVQETWLGVIQGLDRFEGRSSLKTWILSILVHKAKSRGVREARSVPFASLGPDEPAVAPERFRDRGESYPGHWRAFPRDWSASALGELREKLARSPYRFTPANLQKAHEVKYRKAMVDIVSMVKHAADEEEPLFTAAERVERAFAKVIAGQTFTPDQQKWLDRIKQHMRENLSIDPNDFDDIPVFSDFGGLRVVRKVFGAKRLDTLIETLNEAIAA